MRNQMKFFIFFLILGIQTGIYAHGFTAGTLVKSDTGYTKIQEITCGESLVSYDLEHGIAHNQVKAVWQKSSQELICIKTDTAELMVDAQQLLYAYDRLEWVSAHLLKCGDRLLSARYGPITIRSLEEYTESETVHCCSFERIHTFCVSSDEIVVHNFTIGIDLLVWPTIGKIITVGCLALGSYLLERTAAKKGIQLNIAINSQSATFWHVSDSMGFKTNSSFSDLSKASAHPLPSDLVHGTPARSPVPLEQPGCRPIKQETSIVVTEFDSIKQTKPTLDATPAVMIQEPAIECFPIQQQETLINSNESLNYPFGEYQGSPKHHTNSQGEISKAPKNGQKALDSSYQIKAGSKRRIAYSDDEFVILDMTQEGIYHGHVRTWDELDSKMQNILIELDLVNRRGKPKK